jgi:DnaJ-class molecular chaperone
MTITSKNMAKDYYQILGVARGADEKEIKKAYRKLAREYHPDANKGADAEARFKEINQAYQVLRDADKRKLYDQFGPDFERYQAGGAPPPPPGSYGYSQQGGAGYGGTYGGNVDFSDIFNQVRRGRGGAGGGAQYEEVDASDIGDIFGDIFRGCRGQQQQQGGGFNFRRQRGPQKGQDAEQPIDISLAESVRGTQRSLQMTIRDPQTGEQHQRNVTIKIPAGVQDGARVRAAKQGAPGQNGGANGDLFLKIHIEPHAFWKREGDNIHCEVPVTFAEAALGATIEVPTINGAVKMKIPAGTQSGQTFRLSGRGVKHLKGGGHGDQFVKVKVDVPKKLETREAELVQELAQLRDQNVRRSLPTEL